uniref:Glucuronosyltransferase n=1 Tax=Panagrolaimus sp. PS1159 TaxID=55785 RepID=A0AC35FIS3_9BILA
MTGSKNKNIRYYTMPKNLDFMPDFGNSSLGSKMWEEKSFAALLQMRAIMAQFSKVTIGFCELVMNDNENLKKLKAENFDLGITELFHACGLGIFHKIGLKKYVTTIGSSLYPATASLLGIKYHPSYLLG